MKKLLILLLSLALLLSGCFFYPMEMEEPLPGGALTVHFIDVGQADATLLECDGKFLLVDGGNIDDGSLMVSYLEKAGVEELEAVVCTHAHEDHVGGLASVLAVFPTKAVYSPTRTHSSKCFDDFMYYADQQGLEVIIPQSGDTLTLGGTQITVLGPLRSYAEVNDTSIVLLAQYGSNTFLLPGDMELEAETDLLDAALLGDVDVLKAGHHGSSTSTGYRLLYTVIPEYAVISCGKDNSYGHPHWETMSKFKDAGVSVFRTDEMGTILAVSDGRDITFTWENPNAEPAQAEPADIRYIGNVNSRKFHLSTCTGLPSEKNAIYFDSYQDALDAGYTPCTNCMK